MAGRDPYAEKSNLEPDRPALHRLRPRGCQTVRWWEEATTKPMRVCSWHKAVLPASPVNVRCWGPTGLNVLSPSLTAFDPELTKAGPRQSRRFDDLLARGGQPGQRQNRFRFTRQRVQRRFLEPEVELATAAVAWERRGWRLAFRTVSRTGDLDMKMLGVTIPGTHLVKPGAISSGLAAQRLLDRGID